MKKQYLRPNTETICTYGLCQTPLVQSINKKKEGGGALSKTRDEEDEEAYIATGGEGEATYGELW